MPFVSYATPEDMTAYVSEAIDALFDGDEGKASEALKRSAREMNERLKGSLNLTTVPVAKESDGSYAEILVKQNVHMAIWLGVGSEHAGERFEENWDWVRATMRKGWLDIEGGNYSFGDKPDEAAQGSRAVKLSRASV